MKLSTLNGSYELHSASVKTHFHDILHRWLLSPTEPTRCRLQCPSWQRKRRTRLWWSPKSRGIQPIWDQSSTESALVCTCFLPTLSFYYYRNRCVTDELLKEIEVTAVKIVDKTENIKLRAFWEIQYSSCQVKWTHSKRMICTKICIYFHCLRLSMFNKATTQYI